MTADVTVVATHEFGNITAVEKVMERDGAFWRYTVSGSGDKFVVMILSNTTGHLFALPLADTERLIALCKEDMRRVKKHDFITMADCMEDFLFNHTFISEPYISAPQNVLIVDSPTDKLANPMQRAQMLRLCPGAKEYHFSKGGHVTMVNCRDEYVSVLKDFWI